MIKKYFGTDGIRGKVNGSKINGEMFFKFGLAAGTYFKNLKNQIDSPVLWTKRISNMKNDKATRMVEVGPGKVLQGLTKKIDKDLECSSLENLEQVNEFDYV